MKQTYIRKLMKGNRLTIPKKFVKVLGLDKMNFMEIKTEGKVAVIRPTKMVESL